MDSSTPAHTRFHRTLVAKNTTSITRIVITKALSIDKGYTSAREEGKTNYPGIVCTLVAAAGTICPGRDQMFTWSSSSLQELSLAS